MRKLFNGMILLVLAALPVAAEDAAAGSDDKKPNPTATLHITQGDEKLGDIKLELDVRRAPITVQNFLKYAESGFYNGTIFHRVMSNFMIQGGQFDPQLDKKTEGLRPPIKNEWQNGLKNKRGTIAMARLGRQPDSATAQFFINVVDNAGLDQPRDGAGYAVFGKVVEGLDVVDKIRQTPVEANTKYPAGAVVPKTAIIIKDVTVKNPYSPEEIQKLIDTAAERLTAAREAEAAEATAALRKAAEDFAKEVDGEVEKLDSMYFVVIEKGSGASPEPTDRVKVHYTGWLMDGELFDSSYGRGTPAEFPLNRVIPGWQKGVADMNVGEKRKLFIPYELAYGERGRPPRIPPRSALVFEIELLEILSSD